MNNLSILVDAGMQVIQQILMYTSVVHTISKTVNSLNAYGRI